jgi:predicted Zn-dependent protease
VAAGLVDDAKALRDQISKKHAELSAREERQARYARMLARFEEIRCTRGADLDAVRIDEEYLAAFREVRLDPSAPSELAVEDLPEAVKVQVAATLDDWVWLRRTYPEVGDRSLTPLLELARLLDPDPVRIKIRNAIADGRLFVLGRNTSGVDLDTLPARTVDLFALAHWVAHKPDLPKAGEILTRAVELHPSDFWLHFHLSQVLLNMDPADHEGALQHLEASTALRPRSKVIRNELVTVLERAAELDRAAEALIEEKK